MSKSPHLAPTVGTPTILPPITGTPLDYVPTDAPADGYVPKHDVDRKGNKRGSSKYKPWRDPDHWFSFRLRPLRRAAIAAIVAGVAVASFVFAPFVFVSAVAIIVISGCVWLTDKLIKAIDTHGE